MSTNRTGEHGASRGKRAGVALRKLNALVAVKVMGWKLHCGPDHIYGVWKDADGGYRGMENDPEFSSEIADAFRVVERMRADGWLIELGNYDARGSWWCSMLRDSFSRAEGDTAPEAICRAALYAIESKGAE